MYKKFSFLLFFFSSLNSFYYMNNQPISAKSELTGNSVHYLDYNILDDGNGQIGGNIRVYGIHNMSVTVQGYKSIDLVKDDVCLYPNLFTILGSILWNSNMFVQRWACVKWFLPLKFGFEISNNQLIIVSSLSNYLLLSPLRAKKVINLIRADDFNSNVANENRNITVWVNGRGAVVKQKRFLSMYSTSSFHPYAVLARQLFL